LHTDITLLAAYVSFVASIPLAEDALAATGFLQGWGVGFSFQVLLCAFEVFILSL
jgi:hypothetical protein